MDHFADLAIDTDRRWCPSDAHWSPYYHRTPLPPPARPATVRPATAIEYVTAVERYVLTYLAVEVVGRQSPTPPTATDRPGIPAFPDTTMRDLSASILVDRGDELVVQLTYERVVEGQSRGTYTVNFFVSRTLTIRAAADGDVSPGPNPTVSGTILDC